MAELLPRLYSPGRLHEIDQVLGMPDEVNCLREWTYWLYALEDLRSGMLALTVELAEANARADALFERKLPCREAEIAQARYEAAEADLARCADACCDWQERYENAAHELAEAEAAATGMREALEGLSFHDHHWDTSAVDPDKLDRALATTIGRDTLERLRVAEEQLNFTRGEDATGRRLCAKLTDRINDVEAERDRYFRALLDIVEGPEDENPYRVAYEALSTAGEVTG